MRNHSPRTIQKRSRGCGCSVVEDKGFLGFKMVQPIWGCRWRLDTRRDSSWIKLRSCVVHPGHHPRLGASRWEAQAPRPLRTPVAGFPGMQVPRESPLAWGTIAPTFPSYTHTIAQVVSLCVCVYVRPLPVPARSRCPGVLPLPSPSSTLSFWTRKPEAWSRLPWCRQEKGHS